MGMATTKASAPKDAAASFQSFEEFYPAYLAAHRTAACRRMHLLGMAAAASSLIAFFATGLWWTLALVPILGYSLSWTGHFLFEGNQPALVHHPYYSFLGDFRMVYDTLRGRLPL